MIESERDLRPRFDSNRLERFGYLTYYDETLLALFDIESAIPDGSGEGKPASSVDLRIRNHLGIFILDLFNDATGFIDLVRLGRSNRSHRESKQRLFIIARAICCATSPVLAILSIGKSGGYSEILLITLLLLIVINISFFCVRNVGDRVRGVRG